MSAMPPPSASPEPVSAPATHGEAPASFPLVKICGITNLADAELALELGAWALGMIFYEGSPRRCSQEQAQVITAACS
jgi:hypothetical protein